MGKICEVCQKGAMSGHNVSHSNRKSNRVWLPNTQRVRVTVYLSPDVAHALSVTAAVVGRERSDIVNEALRSELGVT